MFFYRSLKKIPGELAEGLKEIEREFPLQGDKKNGAELVFSKFSGKGNSVAVSGGKAEVKYNRRIDAFRALGRLFGELETGYKEINFKEEPGFETLGVMIDCSRNGVMRVEHIKSWLRKMALMGINALTLYTEDTYEIENEPFFGYLRGRYTYGELKELNDYAGKFGIEMFPCIQTLGHLEQVLKWETYDGVSDTSDILLVGDERTYSLVEKMVAAASKPFDSKRIHIGMDEAHGLGEGKYREKHGVRKKFDIMNEHLHRVVKICAKYDLSPMIWSDMYFRIGSETGDYYDKGSVIPQEVEEKIPKEIRLVYWDYFHTDYDFYVEWIERHRGLGFDPVVAPGGWTWNRFWALLPHAFSTIEPCMKACRDKGVKDVLLTIWGDDGTECNYDSALPALQLCAEYNWAEKINRDLVKRNFRAVCKYEFEDFVNAGKLDILNSSVDTGNPSKILLWDDPVLGMWSESLEKFEIAKHYSKLSKELDCSKNPGIFAFPSQLAKVISMKIDLRKEIIDAYKGKDLEKLSRFSKREIPLLESELKKLRVIHKKAWFLNYKPFGWEVLDLRYGGAVSRLESLGERVSDFVNGKCGSIPEFEGEHLDINRDEKIPSLSHRKIVAPTLIV